MTMCWSSPQSQSFSSGRRAALRATRRSPSLNPDNIRGILVLISRRRLLMHGLLTAPAFACARAFARANPEDIRASLADLEKTHGGRLGVCVLDVATGRRVEHRADERFAMCSTHKFLAAAFVLQRVDRGEDSLERRIPYSKDNLVTYSPITEKHVGDGMTLGELCEAALTQSDNTAANLILETLGGP